MIKVIASDMDGTLLGTDRQLAPETLKAIRRVQEAGLRFILITGRDLGLVYQTLGDIDLNCDYILLNGGQVRNAKKEVIQSVYLPINECEEAYEVLKDYPLSPIFLADRWNFMIGTPEEIEESLNYQTSQLFADVPWEKLKETEGYQGMKDKTIVMKDIKELRESNEGIFKIMFFGEKWQLQEARSRIPEKKEITVTSSFPENFEILPAEAQKGPVLKDYIESLGYAMDEVLVLGDGPNDCSMLSMDFGATVAMGNAEPEVKEAARYVTLSNDEQGAAYVMEQLLKKQAKKEGGE